METVEGNEVIARFMEFPYNDPEQFTVPHPEFSDYDVPGTVNDLKYHRDYNWLLPAWVKFRDLKEQYSDNIKYTSHYYRVTHAILHAPISEAFTELVSALKWYESLKK